MKRQAARRRLRMRQREARLRESSPEHVLEAGAVPRYSPYTDEVDARNPWDQGKLDNWTSVMGKQWWLWFGK
jgi:hypothetical protein